MEKAYKHVDWDFVIYTIRRFSFGGKQCDGMRECISSTSFSMLVNGSTIRLIRSPRRIRQGGPLSPFLFTIVAEALSVLLFKARECDRMVEISRRYRYVTAIINSLDTTDTVQCNSVGNGQTRFIVIVVAMIVT